MQGNYDYIWAVGEINNNLVIVTPVHRDHLSQNEIINLQISLGLNKDFPHYFIVPEGKDFHFLEKEFSKSKLVRLPAVHFESIQTYNKLMLSPELYQLFIEYEYLLILQLDAILVQELTIGIFDQYDYIGAPWARKLYVRSLMGKLHPNNRRLFLFPFRIVQVGNGGLSARNISTMLSLTLYLRSSQRYANQISGTYNEDLVISYWAKRRRLSIPSPSIAANFFCEQGSETFVEIPNILGFHALEKIAPHLQVLVYNKFAKYRS